VPTYSGLTDEADDILFSRILANQGHVLQPLLPDRHTIPYSLRERSHNSLLFAQSYTMHIKGPLLQLCIVAFDFDVQSARANLHDSNAHDLASSLGLISNSGSRV